MEEIETKRKQQSSRQSRTDIQAEEHEDENKDGIDTNPYNQSRPRSQAEESKEQAANKDNNDSDEFEEITRQDVGSDDEPVSAHQKQRSKSGSAADLEEEEEDDFIVLPSDKRKQKKKKTKMKMLQNGVASFLKVKKKVPKNPVIE